MSIFDVVVVGGGIVGLSTAMALSENSKINLLLIEAEKDLARHQTGNNSGVIHSGLYYKPGSLKAQNCVEGRKALYSFCRKYEIKHEQCGKLVVATDSSELPRLQMLYERGMANGLQGLQVLKRDRLKEFEPHVKGIGGLWVPETGIVDYVEVANTYARIIRENGQNVQTETRLYHFIKKPGEFVLETSKGPIKTRFLINCAGLYSDRVARLCGVHTNVQIVPFRGEYYVIRPERRHLVKNLIYPVPDPKFPFLGVHFTRMINGNVEAGPNAVLAFAREGYSKSDISLQDTLETFSYPGFVKLATRFLGMGLGEFYRSFSKSAFTRALQKMLPEIQSEDIVPAGAGVRAQALSRDGALVDDFKIEQTEGMIHVLNAPSPAATASISIGRKIADLARKQFALSQKPVQRN